MSTGTNPQFGAWLRGLRAQRDLTQERLATQAGCAVQTIRTFESGSRHPSWTLAERLADALELPASERARFISMARASEAAPAVALRAAPTRLPHPRPTLPPAAELIGREAQLAEVARRLRSGQRLVTIVGPGGMGKTSLAL